MVMLVGVRFDWSKQSRQELPSGIISLSFLSSCSCRLVPDGFSTFLDGFWPSGKTLGLIVRLAHCIISKGLHFV
jgi:hypothetical protein